MGNKINSVYVFISEDKDGDEGICAFHTASFGWMPMVAANKEILESLRPIAKDLATVQKSKIKLIELNRRTDLEVISGETTSKNQRHH